MEKMIQALFNSEEEAFKGLLAIQQLDIAQDVSLGESYILSKDENGNTAIRSAKDEEEGYRAIGGGIIGGLIGLLAGPLGFLIGIGAGMVAGAAGDTIKAEGVSDYLDKISANIPNGKSVLVAHIWEDWETPVDTVLIPLTKDIYRMNISEEIFIPAQTELEKVNEDITAAETQYLAANNDEKSAWNEKLLLLKIRREELTGKLKDKTANQEKQYAQWLADDQLHADRKHTEKVVHDQEKHDRLERRIAGQQERMEQLRKNR